MSAVALAVIACGAFPAQPRGGASFSARFVERIDSNTARVDIGPSKASGEIGGTIIVRADDQTLFDPGGNRVSNVHSLAEFPTAPGERIEVVIGARQPDGTYLLVRISTNAR